MKTADPHTELRERDMSVYRRCVEMASAIGFNARPRLDLAVVAKIEDGFVRLALALTDEPSRAPHGA